MQLIQYLKFEVFNEVNIKIMVLWGVTQCSFVYGCQFFREICCLHGQLTTLKTINLNLIQVSTLTNTFQSQWCRRVWRHQDNALIHFKQSVPWLFLPYCSLMQLESDTHFLGNISVLIFILLCYFVRYSTVTLFQCLLRNRGEFRHRQTRQLPRAVDLKGWFLSCQSY
jgi:hypothetical protein